MTGVIFPVAVYCSETKQGSLRKKISEVITEANLRNTSHLFLIKC